MFTPKIIRFFAPNFFHLFYFILIDMKKSSKNTMIVGRHPIVDAINNGNNFDKIIIQKGIDREFDQTIKTLSRSFKIPLQIVPREKLNRIYSGQHQGVIGFLSLVNYFSLDDVLPMIYEKSEVPLLLLLDGVTDVRNFGSIARSAEICGVHAIVLPEKGAAQINPEALKTSAGALTKILICRETSLVKAISTIQMNGITVLASNLGTEQLIYEMDFTIPTALVIGSEGDGVSSTILKKVDKQFIIPQKGTTDSFNVSVATGIMLYEVMRQRGI
jgi:23S rRNA (guanosine2251-2'-O)-methyltransferase